MHQHLPEEGLRTDLHRPPTVKRVHWAGPLRPLERILTPRSRSSQMVRTMSCRKTYPNAIV